MPIGAVSFQGSPLTFHILDSQSQESTPFIIDQDRHIRVTQVMDYENPYQRDFNLYIRATETSTNSISEVPVSSH